MRNHFSVLATPFTDMWLFLIDEALVSISQTGYGQLVKMFITLEPNAILGSKLNSHWCAKRWWCFAEHHFRPSMSLLVKMLITLDPHGIFFEILHTYTFWHCLNTFFLSLYTARPSFEYYRQVYFVHSGLCAKRFWSLQINIMWMYISVTEA